MKFYDLFLCNFERWCFEYFIYDENRKTLIGERTNRVFKIGDQVKIRVIEANKMLRKIAFELVADKNEVKYNLYFKDEEIEVEDIENENNI